MPALIFPTINPVALSIGPIQLHWYGLTYAGGILLAWFMFNAIAAKGSGGFSPRRVEGGLFWGILAVVIGARLGYVLLVDRAYFLAQPLEILAIWRGGLSFFGGLCGLTLALYLFCAHRGLRFTAVCDRLAWAVPLGLGIGRCGNFLNGELYGRVTTLPWGMIFPHGGPLPRHPSQIYEILLEGPLLFAFLEIARRCGALNRPGLLSALFLCGYGCLRFAVEFLRAPDPQTGLGAFGLTQWQFASLGLLVLGLLWCVAIARRA